MPANYVLLEKITVGAAGTSSVTFSSIPQTGYTDLVVKVSARATYAANFQDINIRFNGSATGYSSKLLQGDGSAATAASNSSGALVWGTNSVSANATANTFSNGEAYIPNYTSANFKYISVDSATENNATAAYAMLSAGIWSNTAAITSIELYLGAGNYSQYTTFYLYGVAKLGTTPAISPKATGGSIIETDGTYWYHAFLSSGTFTPTIPLSCDVITIAGGAGGGGGGGGAGGLLYSAAQSIATAQTVTIGAGGGAAAQGSNSVFGSLTATGGGRPTFSGGSGGGSESSSAGGTGTAGQGNNGGSGVTFVTNCGFGGGGGAGAVGGNGTTTTGGVGGAGTNTYSTWLNTTGTGVSGYIAGGGGGGCGTGTTGLGPNAGAGGAGGGAQAGVYIEGANATANTGSGGGGSYGFAGGSGGSGLVIVRYAV
jgi:hypothetical protein